MKGFTLVELLVVIGIIAVLISILLPSLARARQQALLISCASNMRQVYQALALYAQDSKGYLPFSEVPGSTINGANIPGNDAIMVISNILGVETETNAGSATNNRTPVVRCPVAIREHSTPWADGWETNWKWNTGFNFRAMPKATMPASGEWAGAVFPADFTDVDNSPLSVNGWWPPVPSRMYKPRQINDVTPVGEVMLAWDGPQDFTGFAGNNCIWLGMENAGWRGTWQWCGFRDSRAMPGGFDYNTLATLGVDGTYYNAETIATTKLKNIDVDNWNFACSMRFRHLNNDTTPVLFSDGHVETRKVGTVTWNDISLNFR